MTFWLSKMRRNAIAISKGDGDVNGDEKVSRQQIVE